MAKVPRTSGAPPARRLTAARSGVPTSTECAQLRIRVVALENLVIAMLAQAPEHHLALAREMALHISPRPGFTAHRLTLHAAEEMRSLVLRARRFRAAPAARATSTEEPT